MKDKGFYKRVYMKYGKKVTEIGRKNHDKKRKK